MMKFYLYVILGGILLTFPLVAKAQLCPTEVSTDPRNPSNPDRPEMENTFYWFPHNGDDHNSFEIIRITNTQKIITASGQNKFDEVIQIRRCSESNEKVSQIYKALNYKNIYSQNESP